MIMSTFSINLASVEAFDFYAEGHFRTLRALQRSLQRQGDGLWHTMQPLVTPWTSPTPWTQPQSPHSASLRVLSYYQIMMMIVIMQRML